MPRVYVRKTDRMVDENAIKLALKNYFGQKISIRGAARQYNIKRDTLMSRIKKVKEKGMEDMYSKSSDSGLSTEDDEAQRKFQSKYSVKQVFSIIEEENLVKYIKRSSTLHYGLSYRQIRSLAYEYASNIPCCRMPAKWKENKTAGVDWLYGFMARHSDLSLRKPESTSILRSTGFNRDRVNEFFDNYCSLLKKYKFTAGQIFNLDESGVTTVIRPPRIVSEKGKKQVGQISSGERGELVTFVGIINALGNALPPVYVVPRIRNPEEYITGAPESSLVLNNKSGWMTKDLFLKVLGHIKIHTHCSKEQPILLLLDNHESHVSYESIKYCKDNGISLLSFPPHSTHRVQPLDVGVFGPFKASLVVAFDDWLLSNPGKLITIRNIGELSNIAFKRAFSMSNISNAFKKTGIWPINRQVFTDDDFAASTVTDRQNTEGEIGSEINSQQRINAEGDDVHWNKNYSIAQINAAPTDAQNIPSSSKAENNAISSKKRKAVLPEDIKPYPKATRDNKKKRNRQSKSKIYTSTPIMDEIKQTQLEKQRKQSLKTSKSTKRQVLVETDEETDSAGSLELIDSDLDSSLDEFPIFMEKEFVIKVNDFVLTKFCTKTSTVYYIGQVLTKDLNDYEIKFLRRKNNSNTFSFPIIDDIVNVERDSILMVLPTPQNSGTARTASLYKFKFNFKGWDVR